MVGHAVGSSMCSCMRGGEGIDPPHAYHSNKYTQRDVGKLWVGRPLEFCIPV